MRIDASGGSDDTAGGFQFDDGYWDDFRYGAGFNHDGKRVSWQLPKEGVAVAPMCPRPE